MFVIHVYATSCDHLYLVLQHSVGVELEKELIDCKVKGWHNFLGVANKLRVEVTVEEEEVFRVDIEEWLLKNVDLAGREVNKSYHIVLKSVLNLNYRHNN